MLVCAMILCLFFTDSGCKKGETETHLIQPPIAEKIPTELTMGLGYDILSIDDLF